MRNSLAHHAVEGDVVVGGGSWCGTGGCRGQQRPGVVAGEEHRAEGLPVQPRSSWTGGRRVQPRMHPGACRGRPARRPGSGRSRGRPLPAPPPPRRRQGPLGRRRPPPAVICFWQRACSRPWGWPARSPPSRQCRRCPPCRRSKIVSGDLSFPFQCGPVSGRPWRGQARSTSASCSTVFTPSISWAEQVSHTPHPAPGWPGCRAGASVM